MPSLFLSLIASIKVLLAFIKVDPNIWNTLDLVLEEGGDMKPSVWKLNEILPLYSHHQKSQFLESHKWCLARRPLFSITCCSSGNVWLLANHTNITGCCQWEFSIGVLRLLVGTPASSWQEAVSQITHKQEPRGLDQPEENPNSKPTIFGFCLAHLIRAGCCKEEPSW